MRRAALAALAVAALACSSRRAAVPDASVEPAAQRAPAPVVRRAPILKLVEIRGAIAGRPAPVTDEEPRDRDVWLPEDAAVTLTYADVAKVRIEGPALFRLGPEGEPALLLRQGLVQVDSAPHGERAGERALWLATAFARIEVEGSARFVLRAFADFGAELSLVSGHVRVGEGGAEPTLVKAGDALCLPGKRPPRRSGQTLEQTAERLAKTRSCPLKPRDERAPRERELTGACDAILSAEERERTLLAVHAGMVTSRDPRAPTVQAQLARMGAMRLRLREQARALRAELTTALLTRTTSVDTPLLTRARELAPYRE